MYDIVEPSEAPTRLPSLVFGATLGTMRGSIVYDESEWPLLTISYPIDYSSEELLENLERMAAYLHRERPFVAYFRFGKTRALSAAERNEFAEFLRREESRLQEHCLGVAVQTTSAVHRGVLTALKWVAPMPFEMRLFADGDEARDWARERLATRGLSPRQRSERTQVSASDDGGDA